MTKARSTAGDAWSALVVRVLQLNGLLTSHGDALTAPAGQSSARWQVLAAIEEEPRSVAEIARMLGLARQSVQRVADLLEADKLAVYTDNPSHLRAKLLQLTPRGRTTLARIAGAQRSWADRIGKRLDLRKLHAAAAALDDALDLLRAEPAAASERASKPSSKKRPDS
jgi:DNA-binding MarR family transcriptional regulator